MAQSRETADDGWIDLTGLFATLWRARVLIAFMVLAVTGGGFVALSTIAKKYTAQAQIVLDGRELNVVDIENVVSGLSDFGDAAVLTESEILKSRPLAEKAVGRLSLAERPEFNAVLRQAQNERKRERAAAVFEFSGGVDLGGLPVVSPWDILELGRARLSRLAAAVGPKRGSAAAGFSAEDLSAEALAAEEMAAEEMAAEETGVVNAFLGALKVQPVFRSRVITVSFRSEDPALAARAVNMLVDAYVAEQLDLKADGSRDAAAWLELRLGELRQEVETAERATDRFRAESGLLEGATAPIIAEEMSDLTDEITAARSLLASADASEARVDRLAKAGDLFALTEVLKSSLVERLRDQEALLRRSEGELASRYGDAYPPLAATRAELRKVREDLALEAGRIANSVRAETGEARARLASLERTMAGLRGRLNEANTAEVQFRALEREAEASRSLLETFLGRLKETQEQGGLDRPDARILSYAAVPSAPSFPPKKMILGVLMVFAAGAAMVIVLLLDHFFGRFVTYRQVETTLGLPALGITPRLSRRGVRRLPTANSPMLDRHSELRNSLGSIYAALLTRHEGRPRTIMVTSAIQNEGKSVCSMALALFLGQVGERVLLIDADARRPRVHKWFRAPRRPGLSDLIIDGAKFEEAIRWDPRLGISYLAAGEGADSAAVFGSEGWSLLLGILKEHFDVIVIDTPPILAVRDALLLADRVDATILAAKWKSTRRALAREAIDELIAARAKIAGVVLTRANPRKVDGYRYREVRKYRADQLA